MFATAHLPWCVHVSEMAELNGVFRCRNFNLDGIFPALSIFSAVLVAQAVQRVGWNKLRWSARSVAMYREEPYTSSAQAAKNGTVPS